MKLWKIIISISVIVPVIVGVIEIIDRLSPKEANVNAYINQIQVPYLLPSQTRDFLRLIQELQLHAPKEIDPPYCIEHVKKSILGQHTAVISPYTGKDILPQGVAILTPSKIGSPQTLPNYCYTIEVVNDGIAEAKNIIITLPNVGHCEVYGNNVTSDPIEVLSNVSEVRLSSLSPRHTNYLYIWHNPNLSFQRELSVVFDGGVADVKSSTIIRKEGYFLFEIKKDLVIKSIVSAMVVIFMLSIIRSMIMAGRKRRLALPTPPTDTPPAHSDPL